MTRRSPRSPAPGRPPVFNVVFAERPCLLRRRCLHASPRPGQTDVPPCPRRSSRSFAWSARPASRVDLAYADVVPRVARRRTSRAAASTATCRATFAGCAGERQASMSTSMPDQRLAQSLATAFGRAVDQPHPVVQAQASRFPGSAALPSLDFLRSSGPIDMPDRIRGDATPTRVVHPDCRRRAARSAIAASEVRPAPTSRGRGSRRRTDRFVHDPAAVTTRRCRSRPAVGAWRRGAPSGRVDCGRYRGWLSSVRQLATVRPSRSTTTHGATHKDLAELVRCRSLRRRTFNRNHEKPFRPRSSTEVGSSMMITRAFITVP